MSENLENKVNNQTPNQEEYSLNDDRRVKVLSPGALVARRFFRNRLAVIGLSMLIAMFLFSFLGGVITPYRQDEQFYTYTYMEQEYVGVAKNNELRYVSAPGQEFGSILQAQVILAQLQGQTHFTYNDVEYELKQEGEDLYTIHSDGTLLALAAKDLITQDSTMDYKIPFDVRLEALKTYVNGETEFTADGASFTIDPEGAMFRDGEPVGFITRFVVSSKMEDAVIPREFVEKLQEVIDNNITEFEWANDQGETKTYKVVYDPSSRTWSVRQSTATYVYDRYAAPSAKHWLGMDTAGMDMLTRLMYGGRVSLTIGFIVVFIEAVLGVIMGGISGYFGGWVDNLIMRIVDVFFCIPSTPLIIILGSAMDAMQVDPQLRMLYLMLILGFLGWPGIARMVRGQILSLREQEFMTATEATGVRISRRIFRHLIPNVIPQLIVICTMSLGSTIIMEATLSFLGLGVKFPFASWGNIISDVTNSYVMINYWYVWIPAGICLLIAVLGFNFVGDGLRDAFDPRMKR